MEEDNSISQNKMFDHVFSLGETDLRRLFKLVADRLTAVERAARREKLSVTAYAKGEESNKERLCENLGDFDELKVQ